MQLQPQREFGVFLTPDLLAVSAVLCLHKRLSANLTHCFISANKSMYLINP